MMLHLVTQRGQSYGSVRRCCEICGIATFAMSDDSRYATDDNTYIQLLNDANSGYTICRKLSLPKT